MGEMLTIEGELMYVYALVSDADMVPKRVTVTVYDAGVDKDGAADVVQLSPPQLGRMALIVHTDVPIVTENSDIVEQEVLPKFVVAVMLRIDPPEMMPPGKGSNVGDNVKVLAMTI